MPRTLLILASMASLATTAAAQDGAKVSLGYAYLKYLETDGGNTPNGAYLSVSGGGKTTFELDAAYHRDTEDGDPVIAYTLLAGAKSYRASRGSAEPYLHLLGGVWHGRIDGAFSDRSSTALGGMAGGGVDLRISGTIAIRLGADFQLFLYEGQNFRLNAGLTF